MNKKLSDGGLEKTNTSEFAGSSVAQGENAVESNDPPTKEDPSVIDSMLSGISDKLQHYSKPKNIARLLTMGPLLEGGLSFAKNQIAENLNPVGYGNTVSNKKNKNLSGESRLLKDVNSRHKGPAYKLLDALAGNTQGRSAKDKVESRSDIPFVKERQDLLQMLMNDSSPKGGSISESEYKPSFAVSGHKYYNSPETEASIMRDLQNNPDLMSQFKDNGTGIKTHTGYGVNDNQSAEEQGNVLGNYTMTLQKDKDGREYIDYYDKWDLQPYKRNKGATKITDALQSMAGIEAPEIYGRIYLDQINKNKKQK